MTITETCACGAKFEGECGAHAFECADLQAAMCGFREAHWPCRNTHPTPRPVVTEAVVMPTDDEAWELYRSVRRMFPDEQDAIVRYTRVITAALAARPEGE